MQAPEIVNSTTGKLENGQPSLLCKQSMFARWQYLIKRIRTLGQVSIKGKSLKFKSIGSSVYFVITNNSFSKQW